MITGRESLLVIFYNSNMEKQDPYTQTIFNERAIKLGKAYDSLLSKQKSKTPDKESTDSPANTKGIQPAGVLGSENWQSRVYPPR